MKINIDYIYSWFYNNMKELEKLPVDIIQIEKREISCGDQWSNSNGEEYLFFLSDKSAYLVGYENIIEDQEDWAQAESYQSEHLIDYYTSENVDCEIVMNKLLKIEKLIKRRTKLKRIL